MDEKKESWYKQGLTFRCTGCGQCCTGYNSPGYVWITPEEIEKIAAFLGLSNEEFSKKYTRLFLGRISLKERADNYACVLLKDNKCSVYHLRPQQCRTFPWWPETLESKESWEAEAAHCKGINHPKGTLFSFEEISLVLKKPPA